MRDVRTIQDTKATKENRIIEHASPKTARQGELTPLISWKAPEYIYIPKSADWFWAVGILTLAFLAVAIIMANLLFGIFLIIAGFTIALYGARKPRIVSFSVNARGIQVGRRLYPYEDLESFWIYYEPDHPKELNLESKKLFMPSLGLPLGNADPNELRQFLIKFLPEKRHEPSLTEAIARYLGF
jgi:hypothetical protein